jgi:hypothetical protein
MSKNVAPYLIVWDGPSKSKIQFRVKQFLKPFWRGHICYEEFPVYGTLLKVDLLNATLRVSIEVQGPQHTEYHWFHNRQPFNYLDSIKKDVKKQEWLERNDFRFIEINYDEIDTLTRDFFREKFGLVL